MVWFMGYPSLSWSSSVQPLIGTNIRATTPPIRPQSFQFILLYISQTMAFPNTPKPNNQFYFISIYIPFLFRCKKGRKKCFHRDNRQTEIHFMRLYFVNQRLHPLEFTQMLVLLKYSTYRCNYSLNNVHPQQSLATNNCLNQTLHFITQLSPKKSRPLIQTILLRRLSHPNVNYMK